MRNFTPAWFKKGFFNESLFCDDFLSTHQLLYSNGAFFTPDGRMTDTMPLRCEIFEMMREYVGANLAKKVTNVCLLYTSSRMQTHPRAASTSAEPCGLCAWYLLSSRLYCRLRSFTESCLTARGLYHR